MLDPQDFDWDPGPNPYARSSREFVSALLVGLLGLGACWFVYRSTGIWVVLFFAGLTIWSLVNTWAVQEVIRDRWALAICTKRLLDRIEVLENAQGVTPPHSAQLPSPSPDWLLHRKG